MARQFLDMRISTNSGQVVNNLNRFMTQVPQLEKDLSYKIARVFLQEIRSMARVVFNKFRGRLFNELSETSIQAIHKGTGGWQHRINIRRPFGHGRTGDVIGWNEFAQNGHWVATFKDKNQPIQDYLSQFSFTGVDMPRYVFVEPRPFVRPAIQPAARRMREMAPAEVGDFLNKQLGNARA